MIRTRFFKTLMTGLLLTTFLYTSQAKAEDFSSEELGLARDNLIEFYKHALDRNGNWLSDATETAYYEEMFGKDFSLIMTPGLHYDWDPPEGYDTPALSYNVQQISNYLELNTDDLGPVVQNFLDDAGYEGGRIDEDRFRDFFGERAGFSEDLIDDVLKEYGDAELSVTEFMDLFGYLSTHGPEREDGSSELNNDLYTEFLEGNGWTDPYLDPDYKPDEPEDPDDPIDPDPIDPDPNEPDDPDDPVDPVDPEEPDEPNNPVDPDPNGPDEPVNPEPVEPEPSSEAIQDPEPEPAPATPSANTDIKRIYTVDQAVAAVKNNKNTFSLKYR